MRIDSPRDLPGVVLARHGETDYNVDRRFQGWLPVALNERGRCQAAALAERAQDWGFEMMWCSPLARARETADIVAGRLGLTPREDARLAETDTGEWTDRPFSEVAEEDPERLAAFLRGDRDFAFPGGESFSGQADRVMAALEVIASGPRPVLVVCHGVAIRLALTRLGRAPAIAGGAIAASVSNAALIPLYPA